MLVVFIIILALLILISVMGGSVYPSNERFVSYDPQQLLGRSFEDWNDAYKKRTESFEQNDTIAQEQPQYTEESNTQDIVQDTYTQDIAPQQVQDDYIVEDYGTFDEGSQLVHGDVVEGFPGNMYAAFATDSMQCSRG
jgi:hypothetical protein